MMPRLKDSTYFFANYGDWSVDGQAGGITFEQLYQLFAERFRAENCTEATAHLGYSIDIVERES